MKIFQKTFLTALPRIFLASALLFPGCEKFEYNVFETHRSTADPSVTTQYNIGRLLALPHKDTLRLVFTGDTQRFYDDVHDLVHAINSLPEVDAVFITGDIADFGTALEYELINRDLKNLNAPFLTAIGNHDCLANGPELYKDIYGPLNYSFTWNGIRFVVHNTNSREFNFNGTVPDIDWMRTQLADEENYQSCMFVSHVPPFSDDFDPALAPVYTELIRESKNTLFTSNGHRHDFVLDQPYQDGIWYLNTSSPSHRVFSLVTIYPYVRKGQSFTHTLVNF